LLVTIPNLIIMKYYSVPFRFDKVLAKQSGIKPLSLEESIRENIRFIIFTRLGDFAFDKNLGFEIWDRDNEVFYRDKSMYYGPDEESFRGSMDGNQAQKYFMHILKGLILKYEPRIDQVETQYEFTWNNSSKDYKIHEYQRKISISVKCKIKSSGMPLKPSVAIDLLYSPFKVEINNER